MHPGTQIFRAHEISRDRYRYIIIYLPSGMARDGLWHFLKGKGKVIAFSSHQSLIGFFSSLEETDFFETFLLLEWDIHYWEFSNLSWWTTNTSELKELVAKQKWESMHMLNKCSHGWLTENGIKYATGTSWQLTFMVWDYIAAGHLLRFQHNLQH